MTKTILATLAVPCVLIGCGGGGGGSGSTTPIVASAVSVSSAYTRTGGTGSVGTLSTDTGFTLTTTGAVGRGGSTGDVSVITISGTNAAVGGVTTLSITDGAATGDEAIDNYSNAVDAYNDALNGGASPTKRIYAYTDIPNIPLASASPVAYNPTQYAYLTFGDWTNCGAFCGASNETGVTGYYVAGSVTSPGNIPTSGGAVYNGSAQGVFVKADGTKVSTYANMSATADFAARRVTYNTTGSLTYVTQPFVAGGTITSTDAVSNNALDVTGTLTYVAGSNVFSGSVTDAGGRTGTATGIFFGPAANEIGGVYQLGSGGTNVHAGTFGGK